MICAIVWTYIWRFLALIAVGGSYQSMSRTIPFMNPFQCPKLVGWLINGVPFQVALCWTFIVFPIHVTTCFSLPHEWVVLSTFDLKLGWSTVSLKKGKLVKGVSSLLHGSFVFNNLWCKSFIKCLDFIYLTPMYFKLTKSQRNPKF